MYLLDTNICIYVINGRNQKIIDAIKSRPLGEIALSAVTLAENRIRGVEKRTQGSQSLDSDRLRLPF